MRVEAWQQRHTEQHAADAKDTAEARRQTGERLAKVETTLQARSLFGGAGILLAALAQPVLSHVGIKGP